MMYSHMDRWALWSALRMLMMVQACDAFLWQSPWYQSWNQPQNIVAQPLVCRPNKPCSGGGQCCLNNWHGKCFNDVEEDRDTCLSLTAMAGRCVTDSMCGRQTACVNARQSNKWGHCNCTAGSKVAANNNDCELCPVGEYQALDYQTACVMCPPPTSTGIAGATDVSQCLEEVAKPTLMASPSNPTDGDNVVLTCASTTSGITEYGFYYKDVQVAGSSSPTYNISPSILDTNDGLYSCVAKVGEISSDNSTEELVALTPKTPTLTMDVPNPLLDDGYQVFECASDSELVQETFRFFQNGVEVQAQKLHLYLIDPVSLSDNDDVYTCTLEMGGLISPSSNSVTLEVVA